MTKFSLSFFTTLLVFAILFLISCTDDPVIHDYNSFEMIPTELSATDGTADSVIVISWAGVEDATGYNLIRTDDPVGGAYALIAENISDTFYIDSNLNVGMQYYYKVNAVFTSLADTSAYSFEEPGYAGVYTDTSGIDSFTVPDFLSLKADDGVSASQVGLQWNCFGPNYSYTVMCASYGDSDYTILDSLYSDTTFVHTDLLPGPYSYKVKAWAVAGGDTISGTDAGYRLITNREFFLEVNKTYTYSQKKIGKLQDKDLGQETVGGDYHGTLEYNSYMDGLNVDVFLTYDNYRDFYMTLNGCQYTRITGLFTQNGTVSDTVFIDGIYPGYVDHHIEVSGGEPSGGYYTIAQPGDTSNVQFDDVRDYVLTD